MLAALSVPVDTVKRFGLTLGAADFQRLDDALARITEAEHRAWREAAGVLIG